MGASGTKIPILVPGIDVMRLPLDMREGFVLSRVDGHTGVEDIAMMTGLAVGDATAVLERLISLGAVAWRDGDNSHPAGPPGDSESGGARPRPVPEAGGVTATEAPATEAPATEAPATAVPASEPDAPEAERPGAPAPRQADSPDVASDHPALAEDVELAHEERLRILRTHADLESLSYYALLGVPEDADKAAIRHAYFSLSKRFHPDTKFGKRLGSFKPKMEAIFTRLTHAYETLSKRKSRQAYDVYLALAADNAADEHRLEHGARQADTLREKPAPAADAEPDRAAEARAPCSPELDPEAQRRRARDLLQRRLSGVTPPRPSHEPPSPSHAPSPPSERSTPGDTANALTRSLQQAAAVTGGSDRVAVELRQARRAQAAGDPLAAAEAARRALALAPERQDVQQLQAQLRAEAAAQLADRYAEQAEYEERTERWSAAALSWARVSEGRPNDPEAARRTAAAMVKARADLHTAQRFAQRAVELAPDSTVCRRTLGEVFLAAGLPLNARRELEKALKLDPKDDLVKNLLKDTTG